MSAWGEAEFQALIDSVVSHATITAYFDRVNAYEPKNAPGSGLTCAVWMQDMRPIESGLAVTSALISMQARLYTSMTTEPAEAIDPKMAAAASALVGRLTADYRLDGLLRSIDVLRQYSETGLGWESGYVNIDNKMQRVITVYIPCIADDLWEQSP